MSSAARYERNSNTRSSKKPIRTIKIERSQSPYKNNPKNRSSHNNSRTFENHNKSISNNHSKVHTNNSRVYYEGGYGDESDGSEEENKQNYYQSNVDTGKRMS